MARTEQGVVRTEQGVVRTEQGVARNVEGVAWTVGSDEFFVHIGAPNTHWNDSRCLYV